MVVLEQSGDYLKRSVGRGHQSDLGFHHRFVEKSLRNEDDPLKTHIVEPHDAFLGNCCAKDLQVGCESSIIICISKTPMQR